MAGPNASFPVTRLIVLLLVVGLVVVAVMFCVLPGYEADAAKGKAGVLAAGAMVLLATLVGVVPVIVLAPRGGNSVIAGWLVGGAGRMLFSLVGAIVLVTMFDLPAKSVLLTLAAGYLPLLAVETIVVLKFVGWNSGQSVDRTPDTEL